MYCVVSVNDLCTWICSYTSSRTEPTTSDADRCRKPQTVASQTVFVEISSGEDNDDRGSSHSHAQSLPRSVSHIGLVGDSNDDDPSNHATLLSIEVPY